MSEGRGARQADQAVRHLLDAVKRHDESAHAVLDNVSGIPGWRRHHGKLCSHRFKDHIGQPFMVGRQCQHVCLGHQSWNVVAPPAESHPLGHQPQAARVRFKRGALGPVACHDGF